MEDLQGQVKKNPGARETMSEDLQELGLPHHLLTKILALLPVIKLFHLRLVCKSWNSLLCSPDFFLATASSSSSSSSSSETWLVAQRTIVTEGRSIAQELVAYIPSLGRWLHPPLRWSSTNSSTVCRPIDRVGVSFLSVSSVRVANTRSDARFSLFRLSSSGGLMCSMIAGLKDIAGQSIGDHDNLPDNVIIDDLDYTVVVFNFLTGAVRKLPPPLKRSGSTVSSRTTLISMCADSTSNSYHVILWNLYRYLEVYDSKSRCWKVGRSIQSGEFNGEVLSGDFFWISALRDGLKRVVHAYNAQTDAWSMVETDKPMLLGRSPEYDPEPVFVKETIIKCKGRVLFVAGLAFQKVQPVNESCLQGFGVWELELLKNNRKTATWVEVARTPPELWQEQHLEVSRFAGHGNLIYMTGWSWKSHMYWPLVYDLARDSWCRLPFSMDTWDLDAHLLFEPRLDATV